MGLLGNLFPRVQGGAFPLPLLRTRRVLTPPRQPLTASQNPGLTEAPRSLSRPLQGSSGSQLPGPQSRSPPKLGRRVGGAWSSAQFQAESTP